MKESFIDYGIKVPTNATGNIKTICPKCSHKRRKSKEKCLSVNIDEGVWNCHHCGWTGSLKTENKDHKNMDKSKSYKKPDWKPDSKNKLPDKVLGWFKSRKISEQTLRDNDIQIKTVYMPQRDKKIKAIAFPYKENGQVVNIKYRDLQKNFRQSKNGKKTLFGLDRIPKNEDTLIITEGELDKLALDEAGLSFSVSIPGGAPSPQSKNLDNKFSYLRTCEDRLKQFDSYILAVDNDKPGQKLQSELARRLGYEKCYKIKYPKNCKDINDILMKYGKDKVQKVISSAKEFPIYGVYSLSDTRDKILNFYKNGYKKSYSSGFSNLDEYYKIRPQEFTIITGIPGHGKSEFLDSIIINMVKDHNWKFAIFSPENHPVERHHSKLIEKAAGRKFHKIKSKRIDDILEYLDDHIFSIAPKNSILSLDKILSKTKQLIFRHGVNALVIDPYNELDHQRQRGVTQTEYISSFLSKIRHFARDKDIHIFIVAHPTKSVNNGKGNMRVPTAYDISGSANWYNKADNIISVFRDQDNFTEIHVQKIRFFEIGKKGMITLEYDLSRRNYKQTISESKF